MAYTCIGTKSKPNWKCLANNPTNVMKPDFLCICALGASSPGTQLHISRDCTSSIMKSIPTVFPAILLSWHYLHSAPLTLTTVSASGIHCFSSRKCLLTSPCLPANCLVAGWTGLLTAELILPPLLPWGHRSLSLSCFPFHSSESHKTCLGIWPMGFLPFSLTSSHLRHQLQELLGDAHVVQLQKLFPDNIQTTKKVESCVKVLQR